jgi:hypothetical protein
MAGKPLIIIQPPEYLSLKTFEKIQIEINEASKTFGANFLIVDQRWKVTKEKRTMKNFYQARRQRYGR